MRLHRDSRTRLRGWWALEGRKRVRGLPALLVLAIPIGLVVDGVTAQSQLPSAYQRIAAQSILDGEHDKARLCYERIHRAGAASFETQYGLALALDGLGQPERAVATMAPIAPADRRGFGPAQLWVGARLLRGARTEARRAQAERHLRWALLGELLAAQELAARRALISIYERRGAWENALPHLEAGVRLQPDWGIQLTRCCRKLADTVRVTDPRKAAQLRDQAADTLKRTEGNLRALLASDPAQLRPALRLATVLVMQGEHAGAVKLLEDRRRQHPGPTASRALAEAYAAWALTDPAAHPAGTDRLSLLERALSADPGCVVALRQLIRLTGAPGADGRRAQARLQQLLADGAGDAGTLHLLLGAEAWAAGEPKRAATHTERALRAGGPMTAAAANNLAFMLCYADEPDLPRALALITAVLKRYPDSPRYRDTRGHVLAKLGRWQDALADLEAALPGLPAASRRGTHRVLATVYRELGLPELGAKHEQE